MQFTNKVIIITGASEGIGRALALQLAAEKANLVLAARRIEPLQATADACIALGAQAMAIRCDVSVPAECQMLIQQTLNQYGAIDVLVNNAGISMHAWFEDIEDTSVFEKLFKVNVMGAINCTHAALAALKKSRGLIVGVSSLAGKTGVPARTTYCTTKFAMNGFFEALRIELEPDGVGVTMIQPGVVDTEIRRNGWNAAGERAGSSGLAESGAMSAQDCATHIVHAMRHRQREWIMGTKAKVGLWLKMLAPSIVDNMAKNALSKQGQRQQH